MRRLAVVFAAVLWLAPVGLRLAASDSDAMRCAITCGHAMTTGAACCPMAGASGQHAAMAACPAGDPQGASPTLPAQPVIVEVIHRLAAPEGRSALPPLASATPRGPSARPPDHVPLLLS